MTDPHQAIVDRLAPGALVERAWPLTGGVSAAVVAVAFVRSDGAREQIVVRRHRTHDWKPGQPGGAALEHALLTRLHALALPVPRPRLLDASGALVLDYIEGTTAAPADAAGPMADLLAQIHGVEVATLPALPRREDPLPALREWLPSLALPDLEPSRGAATLLHGDYWPGNLVWQGRDIAAVLDWEDAAVGDPLSDLACARVELACAAGEAATREFTAHYVHRTARDIGALPVWDLYVSTAALATMEHWGLPAEALALRRAVTEGFQRRAIAALGE